MNSISLELEEKIFRAMYTLSGWCTEQKALDLAKTVLDTDARMIVELGVFGGKSLIPMAVACREKGSGFCHGIDPWTKSAAIEAFDPDDENGLKNIEWWEACDLDAVHVRCAQAIEKLGLWPHCSLIQARSEFVTSLFASGSIDVLHIDGNHTPTASCRDVNNWLPLVRRGGLIWFDDTDWPETQQALRIMREQCELVVDRKKYQCFKKIG